jgi:hypothetical protein
MKHPWHRTDALIMRGRQPIALPGQWCLFIPPDVAVHGARATGRMHGHSPPLRSALVADHGRVGLTSGRRGSGTAVSAPSGGGPDSR